MSAVNPFAALAQMAKVKSYYLEAPEEVINSLVGKGFRMVTREDGEETSGKVYLVESADSVAIGVPLPAGFRRVVLRPVEGKRGRKPSK